MIEPGTKEHSRDLLTARAQLTKHPQLTVLVPCFGNRACGALENPSDWCHEETPLKFPAWHQNLGKRLGLVKSQLVYSYLVARIVPKSNPANLWPSHRIRCVSQRLEQKGKTEFFVCTEGGKKRCRVLHSKANDQTAPLLDVERGAVFDALELDAKGSVVSVTYSAT
jgi:hypothetical protein